MREFNQEPQVGIEPTTARTSNTAICPLATNSSETGNLATSAPEPRPNRPSVTRRKRDGSGWNIRPVAFHGLSASWLPSQVGKAADL
jgi:hypothetical protein